MPVLFTCKFDKDPIKNEGAVIVFLQHNPIWPEIKCLRCKYEEDLIKNERAIVLTTFSPL